MSTWGPGASSSCPAPGGLPERVLRTVRHHDLLADGDVVLVAVSGGADSVALLDVLDLLRPAFHLTLHVGHVDHGLRPDSGADAAFVRELAATRGLPCEVRHVEVARPGPGEPGAGWAGLEAAAREARHRALRASAAAVGAARVALGHTADDQAETVLQRLLSGAGPRGLRGMAPARGLLVRPLIETRRAEVEAHLRARGLVWRVDSTNHDPAFLRNRIRHHVLPYLSGRLADDPVEALCRGAAVIRGAVAAIEARAAGAVRALSQPGAGGLVFPLGPLRALSEEVAAEVIRMAAGRIGELPPLRAFAERALRRVLAGPRARVVLGAVEIERSGRWLRVGVPLAPLRERVWRPEGTLSLPEAGRWLRARLVERGPDWVPPRDSWTAHFDADALPPALVVRGRRPGDRLLPLGAVGSRRVKRLLIEAGVPRWERARVPLLATVQEVVWVAGVRRGQAAPVTAATRRILEVTAGPTLAGSGRPE